MGINHGARCGQCCRKCVERFGRLNNANKPVTTKRSETERASRSLCIIEPPLFRLLYTLLVVRLNLSNSTLDLHKNVDMEFMCGIQCHKHIFCSAISLMVSMKSDLPLQGTFGHAIPSKRKLPITHRTSTSSVGMTSPVIRHFLQQ